MADMMGMMLRGMGLDPDILLTQAKNLGDSFERIVQAQDALARSLATLQAGQDAISAAMGLYVAPPTDEIAALIDRESKRFLKPPVVILSVEGEP